MKSSFGIDGMEKLIESLPDEYRHWHIFSRIISFGFDWEYAPEKSFEEIPCICMVLSDRDERFKIKLLLTNAHGNVNFSIANGFCGGISVTDGSDCGFESENRFRLTGIEQDCDFDVFCENISVELI